MIILHKPPSLQPLFHLFFKTIRSLSVLVHSSSWCYHYFQFILVSPYSTYIRFKARQIIGIYRSFFTASPPTTLFTLHRNRSHQPYVFHWWAPDRTYIIPHITYCSSVWCPWTSTNSEILEEKCNYPPLNL